MGAISSRRKRRKSRKRTKTRSARGRRSVGGGRFERSSSMNFAIFDIETRIDKRLVAESLLREEGLDEAAAYERMRADLMEKRGTDFFPLSVHVPVSIAIGSVAADYSLHAIESLPTSAYGEEALVREFWERVE